MTRWLLFALFLFSVDGVCATSSAAVLDEGTAWRSIVSLPADEERDDLRPLDRFVLGWQLGDSTAVEASLEDEGWSRHLREWSRARWERHRGRAEAAMEAYAQARGYWPATREESATVLALFDRERLSLALALGDTAAIRAIVDEPLRDHEDAAWRAGEAEWALRRGQAERAVEIFERAWSDAEEIERRHPVFLGRALAHLAVADTVAAAEAWIDAVEMLRRPERLRRAAAVWDSVPALRGPIGDSERRDAILGWLVRLFRRDDALDLARDWIVVAESEERADLFAFVAEQFYRLRRHEELDAWLQQTWPAGLDAEQKAELEAYPWGVRRRGGHDVEIAEGFDAVARRYAGTDRAAEALWESAWMWELSERVDVAVSRYEEYVRVRPTGPFASAAALRAIFLRWRENDLTAAADAYARLGDRLRDGLDEAAGLWLAAHSINALGEGDRAGALEKTLHEEHPASPMWRPELPYHAPDREIEGRLRDLVEIQTRAWETVGEVVGTGPLGEGLPDELRVVDRLAELGLTTEAEIRLQAWANERRADTAAMARVCHLAWRRGLPEMQGRYGWILERRLRDEGDGARAAGLIAAMPTPFARTVLELAAKLDVPAELVWALMRRESFYDADVVSIAGAYGLLQLIPRTAERMATRVGMDGIDVRELFVPRTNLLLGITYLSGLFEEAAGDRIRALASYNAGERNGLRWQERRRPGEDGPLGILVISYSETRAYVYHVLRHWNRYVDAYGPSGS